MVISSSAWQAGSERVSRRYITLSQTWPTRNTSPATRSWSNTSDDNSGGSFIFMVGTRSNGQHFGAFRCAARALREILFGFFEGFVGALGIDVAAAVG